MKYRVHVVLDMTYHNIEANSEEEAFEIARDAAISGDHLRWYAEEIEEE